MNLSIQGRTAVITGGDSGIGLATAKVLASEGATIILTDKTQEPLDKALQELQKYTRQNSSIVAIRADITNNQEVQQLAGEVKKKYGGADILVNCAGARGAAGNFLTLSDQDWYDTIDIDLMGAVRVCRAFIPQMQAKKWGRIVLIASENAFQPYEEESPYNACKAGIINLAKCLSRAYAKEGVLINTVSPAFIATPMTDAMMEELAQQRGTTVEEAVEWFLQNKRPHIEVHRRGNVEEVAAVIAFLCSGLSSYVNGSNYRVDGGSVESAFG
ncbi:SDR family NAD(P)-dependent oxidoreductase [Rhodocytophaga aerolata]|uniref:SDR family NAD(P)-dependent oxidoreductase n=1 Tax=Rhodocytophaga aerolata TaxID=455078 RepID=A0ABT8QZ77_9BACT|nr:SDR family NAD(P)-dependent oxidoreductase [Rhodocytophaga aerolata]MDO1444979.1 SDR family NAD(P)-dependent oxidoreductase [Rhodocytophaga aerolata]